MSTRDERIWITFNELLSLELHDGDTQLAKERPCKVLYGSIESYKKIYERAVGIIDAEGIAHQMMLGACPK